MQLSEMFPDEAAASAWFESLVWPDVPLPASAEVVGRVRWVGCGILIRRSLRHSAVPRSGASCGGPGSPVRIPLLGFAIKQYV